jgi:hypothetical protein
MCIERTWREALRRVAASEPLREIALSYAVDLALLRASINASR